MYALQAENTDETLDTQNQAIMAKLVEMMKKVEQVRFFNNHESASRDADDFRRSRKNLRKFQANSKRSDFKIPSEI